MKKWLPILFLTLISCNKDYESKAGVFYGTESTDWNVGDAVYTITYLPESKRYSISSNTGSFSEFFISRVELKDNHYQGSPSIWNNTQTIVIELEGNNLTLSMSNSGLWGGNGQLYFEGTK